MTDDTLPSWKYRNPEHIGDKLLNEEWYQRREEHGCSACAHRMTLWGLVGCGIDREPGYRGFCPAYEEAE